MQVSPSSIAVNSASPGPASPPASQSSTVGSFGSFWLPGDAAAMSARGRQRQAGGTHQGKSGASTERAVTNLKQTLHSARATTNPTVAPSSDKALNSPKQKSVGILQRDSKLLSEIIIFLNYLKNYCFFLRLYSSTPAFRNSAKPFGT